MKYKIELTEVITYVNYVEAPDEQTAMDTLLVRGDYTNNVVSAETIDQTITQI